MKTYIDIDPARIRDQIKRAGVNQTQAAKAIGIPITTLHTQLRNKRMPKKIADKIAALGNHNHLPAVLPTKNGLNAAADAVEASHATPKPKPLRTGNQGAPHARIAATVPLSNLGHLIAMINALGGKVLGIES